MSHIILVTGGQRSGKSRFAEQLVKARNNQTAYIATCEPFDEELKERVKKHRESRPQEWETYEMYQDIDKHISEMANKHQTIILDCVTIMSSNLLFHRQIDFDKVSREELQQIEQEIREAFIRLLAEINKTSLYFVFVTNEIGLSVIGADPLTRFYVDVIGRINQLLAAESHEVYFIVSGIPMKIKGNEVL